MNFQSLMGWGKLRCDIPNGTTQGQDCPTCIVVCQKIPS
jgi:hypothetical protein